MSGKWIFKVRNIGRLNNRTLIWSICFQSFPRYINKALSMAGILSDELPMKGQV